MMARATDMRMLSGKLVSMPRVKVTTAATAAVKSIRPRALTEDAYPAATRMVNVARARYGESWTVVVSQSSAQGSQEGYEDEGA